MKRVSFGPTSAAVNICQAIINKNHNFHSLTVSLDVLLPNTGGPRKNPYGATSAAQSKSLFVVAVSSKRLTEEFFINNQSIIPYLNQTATHPEIVIDRCSLTAGHSARDLRTNYGGNALSGRFFSLTVEKAKLQDLTIFAGILITNFRRRRDVYTLSSMDKLIAVRGGQRQESNILLYTDEAKTNIWAGQAYQDNSGTWFRPLMGRPGSGRLYASAVPNTKVVFMSDTEEILNRTLVNLPSTLYNINKGINSKEAIIQNIKEHETNYFSSLYTSKLDSNDLALTFAFNKLAFFRNRGLFSDLIQNVQDLVGSFSLASTKIVRKRVTTNRPTNKLTGGGANSEYPGSEEIVTQAPTFPALAGPGNNILMVAATDTGAKDITYGYYAYGVEFVFIDKTYEKIKNLIDDPVNGLQAHISNLSSLYKVASLPDNYDIYARQYAPAFLAQMAAPAANEGWAAATNAIARYISVLNVFYKSLPSELGNSLQELQEKIYNVTVRPDNGAEGINLLIQIINNLIWEIGGFLKKRNIYAPNSAADLKTGGSNTSGGTRLIKAKYYFNEFVDAESLVNYGYDYLAVNESDYGDAIYNPFRIVSYGKIRELLALENTTYSNIASTSFDSIALTPNFFNLYGGHQTLNTTDPTQKARNSALASLLAAANLYKNSPIDLAQSALPAPKINGSSDEFNTIRNSLRMIEHGGCTIEIDTDPEARGVFSAYGTTIPGEDNNLLDASEKLSEPSPFVINKENPVSLSKFILSRDNQASEGQTQKILDLNINFVTYLTQTDYFVSNTKNDRSSLLGSTTIKNITDRNVFRSANENISTFFEEVQEAAAAPPSRASKVSKLLLGNNPSARMPTMQDRAYATTLESTQVSAPQVATMALAFGTTKKAQYLAGFMQLNDSLMLHRPIWIDLTASDVDNFSTAGESLLCRFVDETSQFSAFNGITAPIYNSLFILSNNLSPPVAPQLYYQGIATSISADAHDTTSDGSMSYATAYIPGLLENQDMAPPATSRTNTLKNTTENLYTAGTDYLRPNGQRYVGYYHINIKNNGEAAAMVGPTHVGDPHETLRPISPRARLELRGHSKGSSQSSAAAGGAGMPPTTPGSSGTGY